ncbi:hypothetical protein RND81_08G072600 [Saponaria officinalis]|uniref:CCR4-NOT transcription complex subunit 10 n=1 Tax=Saponaria officinalis TaxID=3572 RepID=A0AAW1J537_SAPOF
MDSRDSLLLSSSLSVERERGGSVDEDGVVSAAATLAKDASMLFQSEKFGECAEVLNQLLQKTEGDPKILHNVAIAEFLRDGCSDPKKLMEVLINVKRKIEDHARVSGGQTDTAPQAASKSNSVSKGSDMLIHCASAVLTDKMDTSVAALNIATILFHLHEYSKALSILEPLFQNIEPIDKTTALRVCLLILDVAFLTQDASNFSDVINYLEKAFGVSYMHNQTDGGSTMQQLPNLVMKSSSISNNSSTSDDLNSEGTIGGNASEDCLSRTFSDETMEYETLLSTLDISGHSISRSSNLSSASDISRTAADRSLPTINLRLQLPLYKIQLLLLTRNLKAAKREVKQAMNIAREVDSSRALLLKSQLEYARGNYSKAFKLLRASCNQSDVGGSIIINNNIGCIFYQQGNPHTSSIFFHKALRNCSLLWKEKPRKLNTFSQDKSLLIAYNCGLQYLACGKPLLAARFFLKASLVFYNRPLLWFRLGECCLAAMEKGFLKSSENSTHDSVKVHVIGQGKWRQLALENGLLRNGTVSLEEKEDLILETNVKLKLSLPFARQCLHNALHLLNCSESKNLKSGFSTKSPEENESSDQEAPKNDGRKNFNDPKTKELGSSGLFSANGDAREQRSGAHANTAASITMSEYEDICKRENQKIKQAILIDLAFVELELGNPLKALTTALALLNLPECSKIYAFLGHVYAAEALCLMNRPNDAAEHLSMYISGGKNVELPYSEEDYKQWQAKKTLDADDSSTSHTEKHDNVFLRPEEARRTLYVNLASMHTTQGDFEQASRFAAQAVAIAPNNQEAALMSVFLDLKLGKAWEALTKLKRWCRVRFLPYSSQSKAAS